MQTAAYESKQSIMQRIITVFVFTLLVATILYTVHSAGIDAAAVGLRGRHDHRRVLAAPKKPSDMCLCFHSLSFPE